MKASSSTSLSSSGKTAHPWLSLVENQVSNLSFGSAIITVHDGRVVQVEKTEKVRIEPQEPKRNS
jgi:hypothetical protein